MQRLLLLSSVVLVLVILLNITPQEVHGRYPTITNQFPTVSFGPVIPFTRLLGQEDYYSSLSGPTSASSLSNPRVTIATPFTIFVLDGFDHRVVAYNAANTNSSVGVAVLLQDSFNSSTTTAYNNILGGMALYNGGLESRLFVSNNVSINLFTNPGLGAQPNPTSIFPNASNIYNISTLGALAVDATGTTPRLYAFDADIIQQDASRILIFGLAGNLLGVMGQANLTSRSCGASDPFTCFPNPLAITVDCYGNLWTCTDYSDVSGSSSLLSFFPKDAVNPTMSWDGTSQNQPINCGSLAFSPTCNYLAISGGGVVIIPVSWANQTSPSFRTPAYRYGGSPSGSPGPATDSLSFVVNAAWDPANNGGIWVTERVGSRVVYFNTTVSSNLTSTSPSPRFNSSMNATASTFPRFNSSMNATASSFARFNSSMNATSSSFARFNSSMNATSLQPASASSPPSGSAVSTNNTIPASESPSSNSMGSTDSSEAQATITSIPGTGTSATLRSWLQHLLF